MHNLALLASEAALVIKEFEINEDGPLYVKIKGRKSGAFSWILSLLGIDSTVIFEVHENRIEFTKGSLSGRITDMVPLSSISNLGTGYLKPILFVFGAIIAFIVSVILFVKGGSNNMSDTLGTILLITGFILLIIFWLRKTFLVYVISSSGRGARILFKRSIIEGVGLSKSEVFKIIDIVTNLIEKSKSKSQLVDNNNIPITPKPVVMVTPINSEFPNN